MLCTAASWLREHRAWARRGKPWRVAIISAGVVIALVAVADSLYVLRRDHRLRARAVADTRAVVARLSSEPALPVFLDHWRTASRLAYYFGFREGSSVYLGAEDRVRMMRRRDGASSRLGYLCWYPSADRLPPGLVVLDGAVLAAVARADSSSGGPFFPREVPAYAWHPPASWHLLESAGSWRIYRNEPPVPAADAPAPR